LRGIVAPQVPSAEQVGPIVHAAPSPRLLPAAAGIATHEPSVSSQTPTVHSESSLLQSTGAPPPQVPPPQVSPVVHAMPSSQLLPSFAGSETQRLSTQAPTVHCPSRCEQSASVVQVTSHASVQPSSSSPFMPSSHCSPGSTTELPHSGVMHPPMKQTTPVSVSQAVPS